jgi:hypothetical protein
MQHALINDTARHRLEKVGAAGNSANRSPDSTLALVVIVASHFGEPFRRDEFGLFAVLSDQQGCSAG